MATQSGKPSHSIFDRANAAAEKIRERLPQQLRSPMTAIICGSGLGNLQHSLNPDSKVEITYEEIDGMPLLSTEGHEGKLVFGFQHLESQDESQPVMLLVGRAHFYEGHAMDLVTYATRLCSCLGVKIMIVTNAAGGLNPAYKVGDLILLHDHINLPGLSGIHPLRGPNEAEFGVRFPPLSDAYDLDLRRRAHAAWKSMPQSSTVSAKLHEGVYFFVGGPSYETRAECRMLRLLGADVVGMSTVPEVITARHCGMRVLAFSLVTNNAVLESGPRGDDPALVDMSVAELQQYIGKGKANHEEVLEAGRSAAKTMQGLIMKILDNLASN